jgi:cytochrome c oxidase assembly factor CtaG
LGLLLTALNCFFHHITRQNGSAVNHETVNGVNVRPPLDSGRMLAEWQPAPGVVFAVAVAISWYLFALHLRPGRWPVTRTASFLAGALSILAVCCTGIGVYADTLFWVRAVQNLVLLMVSPMLLALGAPLTLLRDVLPGRARARCSRVLHSPTARRLTFPPAMAIALIAPLYVVYLTPLYEPTQRHAVGAGAVGAGLLGAGFLYFWTRLRVDPTPRADPHLITVAMSIAEVVLDGALGVRLWLGPTIAAGYYSAAHSWGPDARLDQTIGAGVLWIGGDLIGLVFLGFVARRLLGEDKEQTARVDAALDAAEAREAGRPQPGAEPAAEPTGALWWETDPRLAHRFRQRGED